MRISCIHQGYELYGSDRCFVESVAALRQAFPQAEVEVVLPRPGPITTLLEPIADRISFEPLWVLRRRALPRLLLLGAVQLPLAVARAVARLRRSDLVYVNTSVIVDYQVAARLAPGKTLLHIHEIPDGVVKYVLRSLASWSRAEIIFNSRATQRAFAPVAQETGHVIYNGVAAPSAPEPTTYDGNRPLRVLLLGRVNRIKGQDVLVRALASLDPQTRARLSVRMVGGAFENPALERALTELVRQHGLESVVSVEPFAQDTAPLYRWADIVTAPSQMPESLGRVAIEAMAYGRPPIVSAIGGLTEVVADGTTGWFVPPGDSQALAARLRAVVNAPEDWRDFGAAARARFEALFSESAASSAIASVVAARLGRATAGASGGANAPAPMPRT